MSWAELLGEPFITLQRPSAVRLLLEERVAARHGRLPVALESHQLVTVGRMVAQGLGVSAVPSLCIQQMEELGACCIALRDPQIERRVGLLWLAGHTLSTAAQAWPTRCCTCATGIARGLRNPASETTPNLYRRGRPRPVPCYGHRPPAQWAQP